MATKSIPKKVASYTVAFALLWLLLECFLYHLQADSSVMLPEGAYQWSVVITCGVFYPIFLCGYQWDHIKANPWGFLPLNALICAAVFAVVLWVILLARARKAE
jgi:hypothetical protein